MNLQESDSFKESIEKNSKHKRNILISIVVCAILAALLIVLIFYIQYKDSVTLKMYIDKTQVSIPANLYKEIDGKTYINLNVLGSDMLGYHYTKGEYGEYNENDDSGYFQNDFEILALSSGEKEYKKYIEIANNSKIGEQVVKAKNENGYSEKFIIDYPVIYEDGNLYAYVEYIPKMFNVQLDWKQQNPYRIRLYTLGYVISNAQASISKYGVKEINGYYENLRAIADGVIVVGDSIENSTNVFYGVIDLAGKEIISKKYDEITYIQNVEEFFITTAEKTVGILNKEGASIISPTEYDKISLLDDNNKLYLVEKDKEFGVLNRKGQVIIYVENDKIGLGDVSEFKNEKIKNTSVLFGSIIPALKNNLYGLYNLDGDLVLEYSYEALGYKSDSKSTSSGNKQSILTIPATVGIQGIIVSHKDRYGIFDINRQELILPCSYDRIYSVTKSGETKYYLEFNGEEQNLEEFIRNEDLANVDENGNLLEEKDDENSANTDDEDTMSNNEKSDKNYSDNQNENERNLENDNNNNDDENNNYDGNSNNDENEDEIDNIYI